jgi:chromosome segregation ATPase
MNNMTGVRHENTNGTQTPYTPRTRNSDALNVSDPVAMHLLTETALSDSKNYEVLSFEELESLKRDKTILHNRIDAMQRKLAIEGKLRDAAQSLNRLYNSGEQGHRRNMDGSKSSNGSNSSDAWSRTEDELAASNRRMDELAQELKQMRLKLEDTQRRILEHTAGVLQITHKGLKKNLRKAELPRSPESMTSLGRQSISRGTITHEFDERSLYPVPDYVNDFLATSPMTPLLSSKPKALPDNNELSEIAHRLHELSSRMHSMVVQSCTVEETLEPPIPINHNTTGNTDLQVQTHLTYLSQSLDALNSSQQRTIEETENVNSRVREMLEKTNSVSKSPLLAPDEFSRGDGFASQLAFSTTVLGQLQSRIETLIEQKDILTRQIQQQRELNTKSDAQRDAQIHDLTEQLRETQNLHANSEEEAKQSQGQISQLIDQLDRARSDAQLYQQQRGMDESNALLSEKAARKDAEEGWNCSRWRNRRSGCTSRLGSGKASHYLRHRISM